MTKLGSISISISNSISNVLKDTLNSRYRIFIGLLVACSALIYSYMYGLSSIRWVDHAVFNYLIDSTILRGDTIFFDKNYFSMYNPYFYSHYLIIYLSKVFGVNYISLVKVINFVCIFLSCVVLVNICKLLKMNLFSTSLLLFLYVFNVNPINFGGYAMLPTSFYPGMIGRPLFLLCIYSFLKKDYRLAYVASAILVWVHFPYAFYFISVACLTVLFLLMNRTGMFSELLQPRKSLVFAILSFLVFAIVILREVHLVSTGTSNASLCPWMGDLIKIFTFGHISAYYVFYFLSIREKIRILLAIVLLTYALLHYGRIKNMSVFKVAYFMVVSSMVICLINYVVVDVLSVEFFYKLTLLRVGWFLSFFMLVVTVLVMQDICLMKCDIHSLHKKIGFFLSSALIILIVLLPIYHRCRVSLLKLNTSGERNNIEEYYWQDICRISNLTSGTSKFLVPYAKIDFYSYSNRVSVFNRYYPGFLLTNPKIFNQIRERFDDFVYPGFLKKFVCAVKRDPTQLKNGYLFIELSKRWKMLDRESIAKLSNKYGINYVIREKKLPLDYPILHENKIYNIYIIDGKSNN